MANIKCPSCGSVNNEEGDNFCGDCGAALAGAVSIDNQPSTEVRDAAPPPEVEPAPEVAAPPPEVEPPPAVAEPVFAGKAKLVVKRTGKEAREILLDRPEMNIGRWDADSGAFPEIDLSEDDPGNHISRRHARIFQDQGEYFIEDAGSVNGTYLNKGSRLSPGSPQKLQSGDEVIIGRTFLNFVSE